MSKFRKKPVVVEAYQVDRTLLEGILFDGKPYPPGLSLRGFTDYNSVLRIIRSWRGDVTTIHGQKARVIENDWVITEPDGIHHYPCKPDIFEATYEPVED